MRTCGAPLTQLLRGDGRLEGCVGRPSTIVGWPAELERCFGIVAGRIELALPSAAPRAPAEEVRPKPVARNTGRLGKGKSLIEDCGRGRDARELVATYTEPEEDICTLGIRELRPFRHLARRLKQAHRRALVTVLDPRPCLAGERAQLELGGTGRSDLEPRRREDVGCLGVPARLAERLRTREKRFDPAAQVGRDTVPQDGTIDTESRCEPPDGLFRRTGLAPLDLADVLLREALAGDLGLRQPRRDPECAEPCPEAGSCRRCRRGGCGRDKRGIRLSFSQEPPPLLLARSG